MTPSQLVSALTISIDASSISINEMFNFVEIVAGNGVTFVNALLSKGDGKLIRVLITGMVDAEEVAAKVASRLYSSTEEVQYETVWIRESAPREEGWFTEFEVGI